jgi:hypothetical protein
MLIALVWNKKQKTKRYFLGKEPDRKAWYERDPIKAYWKNYNAKVWRATSSIWEHIMIDFRLWYQQCHISLQYSQNPISMEGNLKVTHQILATVKVFQTCSSVPGYHNALFQTYVISEICSALSESMKDEFLKISKFLFVLFIYFQYSFHYNCMVLRRFIYN